MPGFSAYYPASMSCHKHSLSAAAELALPWTYPYGPYLVGGGATAVALLFLYKKLVWSPTHENGVPLPPGPPAKWFWEEVLPKRDIARTLGVLVDQYGPVISLRRGSHVTVVIGRMDKEGATLVDRPQQIAAAELLTGGMTLTLQPAGYMFRRLRRAIHSYLHLKAAKTYEEILVDSAKDVILDILNDPKEHVLHALRFSAAAILRVTYGKTTPTSMNDPDVSRARQIGRNFEAVVHPGAYLVDYIPWLKYVPGYGRELKEFHRFASEYYWEQLNRVRTDMMTNNARPSFAKTLLEEPDVHKLSNDEMAYLAGGLYSAGSANTSAGITVMIMAAACNPDAQTRVQEELDKVVGRDRVPTFGDWDMLPQLQAFMLEALRWRPITPTGIPHRAVKDVIWRGLCIPAGATVIGCHWAISRDPVVFPDPDSFDPRRWLTEDGRVRTDMQFYTYGFGRRVCPGQHVANRALYINLALLLWSFRILQRPEAPIVHGANGFKTAITFRPLFEVDFVPRVEGRHLRDLMA